MIKNDIRRQYAEAEAEQAGFSSTLIEKVANIAMTVDDDLDDDSFEEMVGHIIQGIATEQKQLASRTRSTV
jgi:hypothetical protein